MKKIFLIINIVFANFLAQAQNQLTGIVTNDAEEPLPFATVQWSMSTIGTTADSAGRFSIKARKKIDTLVVTYVGYNPAKVAVEPHEKMLWIVVQGIKQLETYTFKEARPDNFVSTLENRHIEQITNCELRKAPCCNLAGSFETNNSVDVNYGNAVTGATEIQMLGLRGIYTQMTIQKRPTFYGLAYPFALEFYPGTWLNGISVSKGASSVEQGVQSLTGQINVDFVKPSEDKAIFANVYENSLGTFEANLHLNKKLKGAWSSGVYLHFDDNQNKWDHDKDGFLNMPQKRQWNGMARLLHQGKVWFNQNTIHVVQDNRTGGQVSSNNNQPLWKVQQDINRVDVSGTVGYLGFDKIYNTLAVIYGATMHKTNELYGNNRHSGTQNTFYANAIYATIIGNTNNRLNVGGSFQYDDYKEKVNDFNLDRTDIMPGVFGEYTYNRPKAGTSYSDWGVIVGLRNDYHNRFGNVLAPRMNVKYNFTENTIIRASAGRGWRVANIIPENLNVLASNRQLSISPNLKPEDGWNLGANIATRFDIVGKKASFNADIYHTRFTNQIIVDQDQDFKNVYFYNLDGASYSNSFMAVMTYNMFKNFDVKLGYKFNDVKTTINGTLGNPPLIPAHRGLLTLDYKTNDETWLIHLTNHFVGTQRLPINAGYPHEFHPHGYSSQAPAYLNVNMQITKLLGRWEIYFGGENLTNYTQHNPILAANDPFSDYFNASQVWGPIMGIRGFVGVRYSIAQGEKEVKAKKMTNKNAKITEAVFEVKGDCGMCKTRIERAALDAGATTAIWSSETHLLTIKYDENNLKVGDIQATIAKNGHDNGDFKASQKVYDSLPGCCQYKRE